jgi:hypothetical protein
VKIVKVKLMHRGLYTACGTSPVPMSTTVLACRGGTLLYQ